MILTNIQKEYDGKAVLRGLDLELKDGEITCILGRSGVGKTTLLNVLAGLCDYEGNIEPKPSKVGYVFQENRLLPHLTVRENLQFVGGRDAMIDELLRVVCLLELADKKVAKLSGGEKRRVAVCRAFCVEAPLVLLDEPFTALDSVTKESLLALVYRLVKEQQKTAVMVTHDVDEGIAIADQVAVMAAGKIVFCADLPQTDGVRPYGALPAERNELLDELKKLVERT